MFTARRAPTPIPGLPSGWHPHQNGSGATSPELPDLELARVDGRWLTFDTNDGADLCPPQDSPAEAIRLGLEALGLADAEGAAHPRD